MNAKYRYGTPRRCVICSREFQPRDKGSSQACCSNACRGALQTRRATRSCQVCRVSFLPPRPVVLTCSRKCGMVMQASRRTRDPMVAVRGRLARFCCGLIHRCLRGKTDRTRVLLGYTVAELRLHLESRFVEGMSWANYGKRAGQWSIDHVRPISSFPASATLAEINALSNLQPLWHYLNCSKKNQWEGPSIAAT